MNFDDFPTTFPVGDGNGDFPVKPAWPTQCRVHRIRQVSRGNYNHFAAPFQSVHQSQKLSYNPLFNIANHFVAARGNGINFVQENDARTLGAGFIEEFAQMGLALPVKLMHHLGPTDREKIRVCFLGDDPGDKRLAGTGGAAQQYSFWRIYPQALKDLGVA